MGVSLAVDIPGGNLGILDVFLTKFKGSAVIPPGIDAFKTPDGSLVLNKDLSPGRSAVSGHHRFAVQFDKTGGLFDKPIHF